MDLPFSYEQFIDVFRAYNAAVFPLQLVSYLLAILLVWLAFKPGRRSDVIIHSSLAFLWLWMGFVYHLLFFAAINPAAYGFAALFIIQGLAFLNEGLRRHRVRFSYRNGLAGMAGAALVFFALIGYPLTGYLAGHRFPASPVFSLPCPTAIFTFGLLLWCDRLLLAIIIIPLLWSIIGFTAAMQLGMVEDIGLLAAGLITAAILLYRRMKYHSPG